MIITHARYSFVKKEASHRPEQSRYFEGMLYKCLLHHITLVNTKQSQIFLKQTLMPPWWKSLSWFLLVIVIVTIFIKIIIPSSSSFILITFTHRSPQSYIFL